MTWLQCRAATRAGGKANFVIAPGTGAAAKLLQLVEAKGVEVLLT